MTTEGQIWIVPIQGKDIYTQWVFPVKMEKHDLKWYAAGRRVS